ncbi:RNA methyltransferase [Candidatus Izimaplasma bacterium]|nr:RNA methyltransferase [Candidatus Izimaplasma bacterium]
MEITSINNRLIKDTAKLHKKKNRDETGLFLVEGYHLYEEAYKTNSIKTIFTIDGGIMGDNVIYVNEMVLEKLAQTKNPQGVLCVCEKVKSKELTDKVLILEKLQDPGNLGTLMRSALAFGFNTIVLDNTVDIYNDKVLRSTQGAIFKLNIVLSNTLDFINSHHEYTYYGTAMNGEDLTVINKSEKLALILGNEGAGVSEEVKNATYKNITIKTDNVESLNVGVAGSIIMYSTVA